MTYLILASLVIFALGICAGFTLGVFIAERRAEDAEAERLLQKRRDSLDRQFLPPMTR